MRFYDTKIRLHSKGIDHQEIAYTAGQRRISNYSLDREEYLDYIKSIKKEIPRKQTTYQQMG